MRMTACVPSASKNTNAYKGAHSLELRLICNKSAPLNES